MLTFQNIFVCLTPLSSFFKDIGGTIAIMSGKNTAGTAASGSIAVVSATSSGSGGSGSVLMQVHY